MEHPFTIQIKEILKTEYGRASERIFESSPLIQYLNIKTRSANRGSKSRGSFANLYALYVLVEDYVAHRYHRTGDYTQYEGAIFSNLFKRQRELPFGSKLQNHALNHRLNEEFKKYFPACEYVPVLRNVETNRYWVNENLLKLKLGAKAYNLATCVVQIIDGYMEAKQSAFESFIRACQELERIPTQDLEESKKFFLGLLAPNIDARIFEIVSYSILKYYYHDQTIYFGFELEKLAKENLKLYKTGRTNANDGGIDFVMKPLGRFFQVTETLDVRKYFLDIDKIEKYPITFVIKSTEDVNSLRAKLEERAKRQYSIKQIIDRYMSSIEEIINIPILIERFESAVEQGYLSSILEEITRQSKIEFNYPEVDAVFGPADCPGAQIFSH
jgi:hypothetical protein